MARRIDILKSIFGHRTAVSEAAKCTRALAAMQLSPDGQALVNAERLSRGVLTSRIIQSRGQIPWPAAIARQQNPEDPAYLPPLSAHLSLCARAVTRLGRSELPQAFAVDPWGWCGALSSPMVSVWWKANGQAHSIGQLPLTLTDVELNQKLSDDTHAIITTHIHEGIQVEFFHWSVILDGQCSIAVLAKVTVQKPTDIELGFSIQPMGVDGASPIFQIERTHKGLWLADTTPILTLASNGSYTLQSTASTPSLWTKFSTQGYPEQLLGPTMLRCKEGQASAMEIHRGTATPENPYSQLAVLYPSPDASSLIVRTNEYSLWNGAIADRNGLRSAGAKMDIGDRQWLLEAVTHRLLIDDSPVGVSGCLGAVALARLGFIQRAGERLSRYFAEIRRDGSLAQGGEIAAVLAWAAAEYVTWTAERSWAHVHISKWSKLLQRLDAGDIEPGGQFLFGVNGSLRWSEIWRVAALLNSVRVLRGELSGSNIEAWGLAGATGREGLEHFLGNVPWSASPERAPDGSSAAILTAGWLGLISPERECIQQTMQFLEHHQHMSGVVWQGGAHVAATSILLALRQRLDLSHDGTSIISQFASQTGALPTAFHQHRGALGHGDDALSAAMFALLALDVVQPHRDHLKIRSNLRSAYRLPTPFGNMDLYQGEAKIRWRGKIVPITLVQAAPEE